MNNRVSSGMMRLWWTRVLNQKMQRALDIGTLILAFALSYLLRFDFVIPDPWFKNALLQLPVVLLLQVFALQVSGVHRFIWRYVGMAEVRAFIQAMLVSTIPLLLLRLLLPEGYSEWGVPISIILMDAVLGFGGVLALRVFRRGLYERYEKRGRAAKAPTSKQKEVLLLGAGRAGVMAAREIVNRGDIGFDIKGFLDDDPAKQRAKIQGVEVLGRIADLPRIAAELNIEHVIISVAQASREQFRGILDVCKRAGVKTQIIPGLYEIIQGRVAVSRVRDVQIEDLLGREPVQLEEENIRQLLTGKCVMVTGAGGSIGSELARQVARFGPAQLLLVEQSEPALFNIDREMREACPQLMVIPLLANVGDEMRMRSIFAAHRPAVVLHAAAHKHVPMIEHNPCEALKNNILATRLVAEMSGEFGSEVFVLISTDKAVRPTSIMGASKRVAEIVAQYVDRLYDTRFVAVRFGNVIGSAGSVIPIFREQIARGGPVTVTHPEMTRYFMTIPEASQLVLQAGAMGEGGEIFILDMGEPIRILQLAKDLISLSGFEPDEDIEIVFTGLRPGEKLFEELEMTGEHVAKTRHPKIFIGKISEYTNERVRFALERLQDLAREGDHQELRAFLEDLLPESHLGVNRLPVEASSPTQPSSAVATAKQSRPAPEAGLARYSVASDAHD